MTIIPVTPEDQYWVHSLFKAAKDVWPSGGHQEWYWYWKNNPKTEYWDKIIVDSRPVGFIHWRHRRDGWRTLHEIVVDSTMRRRGIGRALVNHIGFPIRLKVLVGNDAKQFYLSLGFHFKKTVKSKSQLQEFEVYEYDLS